MRPRQSVMEIFATFLCFEDDTIAGWIVDGRLRRSMQACLDRADDRHISPQFWALYWHQLWQQEPSALAKNHLAAYLQEVCYRSAQKLIINLSGGQSIADFFQIAIVKIDRVIKGFNPHYGTELKNYASLAFTNAIKDTLRQRQEVDVCTDWALLHKVSHKRVIAALQNLGFAREQIATYILAWQCFKTIYAPTAETGLRKLQQPEPAIFAEIAKLYDRERVREIATIATACDGESIAQWLTVCGRAVRTYLYPTLISASQPHPFAETGEFLDNFESTFQDSLLARAIDREAETARAAERSQLQKVLLKALIKVDLPSQRLLQLYYGQGLTQQEIATQLMTKQYTISRRLNRVRQLLLNALGEWSQTKVHESITPNVIDLMSIAIEEWLKVHYGSADLPAQN